jgi:SAM-dependent methyltransferase
MNDQFDRLIAEAEAQQMSGWDWSYVERRYSEGQTPWDYREKVQAHLQPNLTLLDMGTGGGELLASMAPLPNNTWATEGYPPNIPIARARLSPLGVTVVPVEGDLLPLTDGSFDLVINRHESFDIREVYRVLRPGGTFITQQVGAQDLIELNEAFQEEVSLACPEWEMSSVCGQIKAAGMDVLLAENAYLKRSLRILARSYFFLKLLRGKFRTSIAIAIETDCTSCINVSSLKGDFAFIATGSSSLRVSEQANDRKLNSA